MPKRLSVPAPLSPLIISDTTLRDGAQMPGVHFSIADKVSIAKALAEAGVDVIEAGFPAVSDNEIEAVRRIVTEVPGPLIMVLCRAMAADIDAAWDALGKAPPERRGVGVFLATSPLHRRHKLGKTKAQCLDMIASAVAYARQRFTKVTFSCEDGSRTEPAFLRQAYTTAMDAGATGIGFPDTVGVLTPEAARRLTSILAKLAHPRGVKVRVHFHNDLGLATANTLAAVAAGADIVHLTVGGIGERAGNAALEETVMALSLHQAQYRRSIRVDTTRLTALCRLVAAHSGVALPANKAIVGDNVFATSAGVHQDGLLKHPDTYLPFRPELVGADGIRLPLSAHSGKAALALHFSALGLTLSPEELSRASRIVKNADKADWLDADALLRRAAAKAREEVP
ncbi:LeuA family protein [Desulfovibrio sp. TomC]|uniref:LeuA family protein n=1 Tax=Desulfovibrio sp. TomC TaxID=1562888 RepID=UPI0005BD985A|nr:pyruvate carboxyltransferase [Desulfovibrio sp. TomC]